jgi:hypothetical protein
MEKSHSGSASVKLLSNNLNVTSNVHGKYGFRSKLPNGRSIRCKQESFCIAVRLNYTLNPKMKCLRKRKRPTYFLCIEGALDLPASGSSVAMREPTLIPTIITLTPARTAHIAQVELSLMIFEAFSSKISIRTL